MLSGLFTIAQFIDRFLLEPISFIIEAISASIYYFLWISWFIGRCLVQGGTNLWAITKTVALEIVEFYCQLRDITLDVTDYVYFGTGDSLRLAHKLGQAAGTLFCDVLIFLGYVILWLLLLLPRAIIILADYLLDFVVRCIVAPGMNLLHNLFLLSMGLAFVLSAYTFRRYLYMFILEYVMVKLRLAILAKVRNFYLWSDQQLAWMMQQIRDEPVHISISSAVGNRSDCVICLERNRNIVILPCRHLCLCKECSQQLLTFENRCPVCRKDIVSFLPVYV